MEKYGCFGLEWRGREAAALRLPGPSVERAEKMTDAREEMQWT
jgi:hypothetical protein